MQYLNIVFHSINDQKSDLYSISLVNLEKILNLLYSDDKITKRFQINIFFDDGYGDALKAGDIFERFQIIPKLGIITGLLDKGGYLKSDEIKTLSKNKYEICSHSFSHPALSLYDQVGVANNGTYSNMPKGKDQALSKNQILFQLIESKQVLEKLVKKSINKFIYPYGLFNKDVVNIIKESDTYQEAYTCEPQLDNLKNPLTRPRFLYTNDQDPMLFVNRLREAINSSSVGT